MDKENSSCGRHCIYVCQGMSCSSKGAREVLKKIEDELGISCGETTADGEYELQQLSCMGACRNGPNVTIDEKYYGQLTPSRVEEVLEEISRDENRFLELIAHCPYCEKKLVEPAFPTRRLQIQIQIVHREIPAPVWLHVYQKGSKYMSPILPEDNQVLSLHCPHCKMSLIDGAQLCTSCQKDVMTLDIEGGRTLWVCLRVGCGEYGLE